MTRESKEHKYQFLCSSIAVFFRKVPSKEEPSTTNFNNGRTKLNERSQLDKTKNMRVEKITKQKPQQYSWHIYHQAQLDTK